MASVSRVATGRVAMGLWYGRSRWSAHGSSSDGLTKDLFRGRDLLAGLCDEFPDRSDYLLAYATAQRHLMLHFVTDHSHAGRANDAFEKGGKHGQASGTHANDPKVLLELADTLSTASARLSGLSADQSEDTCAAVPAHASNFASPFPVA